MAENSDSFTYLLYPFLNDQLSEKTDEDLNHLESSEIELRLLNFQEKRKRAHCCASGFGVWKEQAVNVIYSTKERRVAVFNHTKMYYYFNVQWMVMIIFNHTVTG